ncbi:hypothetical protein GT370_01420 [Acidocella sp. MX-AZ03]|uniref:hypothetical protein n=1 Tax=Acidocella sp. MX-AZ03 TaxID=2697363 RepID=UPI0022DE50A8|nr:hypothetical protein [Acidocella sp. MX-AZ03]WBO59622.1 hypothetical protein GT370_01420 [Acidocella sp. MX-AZ03]
MSEGPAKPVGLGRQARTWFTRLQNLRPAGGPDAPALSLRDPWPGDPARGARLVKAELEFGGAVLPLHHDIFSHAPGCTRLLRAHLHGFTWLRDLRALGTDAARSRARALAMDYMDTPSPSRFPMRRMWWARGWPPGSAIMISSPPRPMTPFARR